MNTYYVLTDSFIHLQSFVGYTVHSKLQHLFLLMLQHQTREMILTFIKFIVYTDSAL